MTRNFAVGGLPCFRNLYFLDDASTCIFDEFQYSTVFINDSTTDEDGVHVMGIEMEAEAETITTSSSCLTCTYNLHQTRELVKPETPGRTFFLRHLPIR